MLGRTNSSIFVPLYARYVVSVPFSSRARSMFLSRIQKEEKENEAGNDTQCGSGYGLHSFDRALGLSGDPVRSTLARFDASRSWAVIFFGRRTSEAVQRAKIPLHLMPPGRSRSGVCRGRQIPDDS